MSDPRVRVAIDDGDELGEGACWDPATARLLRVDIARGRVHGWDPETGASWALTYAGEVGAALPTAAGGLVIACERTLSVRETNGAERAIATVVAPADHRFNDCRCDSLGRLWAGTMSRDLTPGTAALHRLEPDGTLVPVVVGTTISNGIGWSPADDRMYFVDSLAHRVDVFDFDRATGSVSSRRTLAEIDPATGDPDGLAVDAEGGIWVCLWGGGAIQRYDPAGGLDAEISLPVTNPTCPAFGGAGLDTLYVTSARYGLSGEHLAREQLAGAVLAIEDPGVRGLPATPFAG